MLIIGERINPTGKPNLIRALCEKDSGFIQNEARIQEDAGAKALEINMGVSSNDSVARMQFAVQSVREVSSLPLVIDETNAETIETALNLAGNGAFINTPVDIQKDSSVLFELANRFQVGMIILPLIDGRLPEHDSEHVRAVQVIVKQLEEFGISKDRVFIDAILFALKQAKRKVIETLDRIKRLKFDLGAQTLIGLSNISFGLKTRESINAEFLKLALSSGLDAVICDPLQKKVMEVARRSEPFHSNQNQFLEFAERIYE